MLIIIQDVHTKVEPIQYVLTVYYIMQYNYMHANLDDWLTMHRSITLVDLQLDAQNSYLFIYNTYIKIIYMF
jgi:hypothetical protein